MKNKSIQFYMRIIHRYLGFFLAGIMTVYAISGVILIFRDTDFLKTEKIIEKQLATNLKAEDIGNELRFKNFKIEKNEGDIVYFNNGTYNISTGDVKYTSKELPFVIKKFTNLHKANSKSPLFFLNIFFGVSLLFFVISSFFMFSPKTKAFKKGLYVVVSGIILAIVVIFL
jgi:hypothetical protein